MKNTFSIQCGELDRIRSDLLRRINNDNAAITSGVGKAYRALQSAGNCEHIKDQLRTINSRIQSEQEQFNHLAKVIQEASSLYTEAEAGLAKDAYLGSWIIKKWDKVGIGAAKAYFETDLSFEDKIALFTGNAFGFLMDKSPSKEMKDKFIQCYETAHPNDKTAFDRVLSDPDISDNNKRDIKFLAYSAPEPYRRIYMKHIGKYVVDVNKSFTVDIDGKKEKQLISFYNYDKETINMIDDRNGWLDDLLDKPFSKKTFFHETGHAIDDYEGMLSNTFTYKGKTMNEIITNDVRVYMKNLIKDNYPQLNSENHEDFRALMKSLNLDDQSSFSYKGSTEGLSSDLIRIRKKVTFDMYLRLSGEDNAPASDIYGGVTNNAIKSMFTHSKDGYWYEGTKPTGVQERELWAEFFSAKMTCNDDALNSIKEYFPNAYEAMEEMAKQITIY